MGPLSVTNAVAGLLTAAHEIARLLGPYVSASRETPSIAICTPVRRFSARVPRRGALVGINQVVTIPKSRVLLFAELEGVVQRLVMRSASLHADGEVAESITGA
ncbi:hypothetical protein NUW58_g4594 [Xylaria curta]|uniref:Uncharacterized protein n=1 Tax=Xylaria curta TaxID=42375 RepID=A0ACC1P782_9PEZI|nr:hypothetical protein NUW58_g4594 [Xylaria curta]